MTSSGGQQMIEPSLHLMPVQAGAIDESIAKAATAQRLARFTGMERAMTCQLSQRFDRIQRLQIHQLIGTLRCVPFRDSSLFALTPPTN